MKRGMNTVDDKRKREVRRRNHLAHDLGHTKYRQRVRESKRKQPPEVEDYDV